MMPSTCTRQLSDRIKYSLIYDLMVRTDDIIENLITLVEYSYEPVPQFLDWHILLLEKRSPSRVSAF